MRNISTAFITYILFAILITLLHRYHYINESALKIIQDISICFFIAWAAFCLLTDRPEH